MSKNFVELYGPTGRCPTSPALQDILPRSEVARRLHRDAVEHRIREASMKMNFAELELRVLASGGYRKT